MGKKIWIWFAVCTSLECSEKLISHCETVTQVLLRDTFSSFSVRLLGGDWEVQSERHPHRHWCSESDHPAAQQMESYILRTVNDDASFFFIIYIFIYLFFIRMDYGLFLSSHLSFKGTTRASSHQTSWSSPDCMNRWWVKSSSESIHSTGVKSKMCVSNIKHFCVIFIHFFCHSTMNPWTATITSEMQCSSVQLWETSPWSWKENGISLQTATRVSIEFGCFTSAGISNQTWQIMTTGLPSSDMAAMCYVCSDLLQCRGQREKMWRAGRPSIWISGSFGTLGPFCLCCRNAQKVKRDELRVDFSQFQA